MPLPRGKDSGRITGYSSTIRSGKIADDPPRTSSSYFILRLPQGGLRTHSIEHQLCRDLTGARPGGKFVVPRAGEA